MDPLCPSCGSMLPKMPARKTRCRACGEFIYVRRTPDSEAKRLMTAAQAEAVEREWITRAFVDRVAGMWRIFGFNPIELRQALGAGGDPRQVWAELVETLARTHRSPALRSRAWFELATCAADIGGPRAIDHLKKAAFASLDALHAEGATRIEILAGRGIDRHAVCWSMRGQPPMSIGSAYALQPLPVPNCPQSYGRIERGFCTCSYQRAPDLPAVFRRKRARINS